MGRAGIGEHAQPMCSPLRLRATDLSVLLRGMPAAERHAIMPDNHDPFGPITATAMLTLFHLIDSHELCGLSQSADRPWCAAPLPAGAACRLSDWPARRLPAARRRAA